MRGPLAKEFLQLNSIDFSFLKQLFDPRRIQTKDKSKKNYLEREFSMDRFVRTVSLPDGVDGEKVPAQMSDEILEITAPISAAALPKSIPVKNRAPAKGGGK